MMELAATIEHTRKLSCEGVLPGPAGLILAVAAGVFAVYHLRREFRGRGSRAARLGIWGLPVLRLAVIGLATLLLCQPVVRTITRRRQPPEVLLVIDRGRGMQVRSRHDLGAAADLLERLELIELPGRIRYGTEAAEFAVRVDRRLAAITGNMQRLLESLDAGLPLAPAPLATLEKLAAALVDDEFERRPEGAPALDDNAPRELLDSTDETRAMLETLRIEMQALADDAALVARESSEHPQLLRQFAARLGALRDRAANLRALADDTQKLLDDHRLSESDRRLLDTLKPSRLELARAAALQLADAWAGVAQIEMVEVDGWENAMGTLLQHGLAGNHAPAVLLSDASSAGGPISSRFRQRLAARPAPVSTLLTGADGVPPADIGLRALHAPLIATRFVPVDIAALIINHLPSDHDPRLDIILDNQPQAVLPVAHQGTSTLVAPLTPDRTGWQQLTARVDSGRGEDAAPGNDLRHRMVYVMPEAARVFLVSDRIDDDIAACRALLDASTAFRPTLLLGAPDLGRLRVGSGEDRFPETVEQWQGVALAIVLGGIPESLLGDGNSITDTPPLRAFRDAVRQEGLRVLILERPDVPPERSWSRLLGLSTIALGDPAQLRPADGLWDSLHDLGIDRADSVNRWTALPAVAGGRVLRDPDVALVTHGDGKPLAGLYLRGAGQVLVSGLPPLAHLRRRTTADDLDRLLWGLIERAAAPLSAAAAEDFRNADPADRLPWIVPAQPGAGSDVIVGGGALRIDRPAGIDIASTGADAMRFTLPRGDRLQADIGAVAIDRAIAPALTAEDFRLTPRAAPLRDVAAATGGEFLLMTEFNPAGFPQPPDTGTVLQTVRVRRPWRGVWPLPTLLLLVSCEYLLRRRAGRVM